MDVKVLLGWGMRDEGREQRMSHSSCWCHSSPFIFTPVLCAWHLKTLWCTCVFPVNHVSFSPLTMYLTDSSVFVAWTFFCGSMAVDLKPDVYRLTWRAKSECRGPGSWSRGGPGLLLFTTFPRRFWGQRGEAPLCGLLCVAVLWEIRQFHFLKIPKAFEAGLWHTLQGGRRDSCVYALSLGWRSSFPGSCYRCLRWPSGSHFWGSQLLNFESLPACPSVCPLPGLPSSAVPKECLSPSPTAIRPSWDSFSGQCSEELL